MSEDSSDREPTSSRGGDHDATWNQRAPIEQVAPLVTPPVPALRSIQRDNDVDATRIEQVDESAARQWVAGNLAALKAIDNDADRRHGLVEMGRAAGNHAQYRAELLRQDPVIATAVSLAYETDLRQQADKEDRKAAELHAVGAPERRAADRLTQSLDERMAKSELKSAAGRGETTWPT